MCPLEYQLGPLPPAVGAFVGRMHRVTCVQDVASAGAVLCLRKRVAVHLGAPSSIIFVARFIELIVSKRKETREEK